MSALIRLSNIQKVFFTDEIETHALTRIDLEIQEGEYVAIAGPSGCGKSTLLAILGLLDAPTDGQYELAGDAVESLSVDQRAEVRNQQVGFIFQSFNLISELNVFENVELPLTYRKDLTRKQRKEKVESILDKLNMKHRSKHFPSQLSGGQQQRVAIARALVTDPKVLLADEPTGNLDSKNAEAVMELLKELHQAGTTIVMVTHDPRSAKHAKRTVEIFDGQIMEDRIDHQAVASHQSKVSTTALSDSRLSKAKLSKIEEA